jgi:hypothetical protein
MALRQSFVGGKQPPSAFVKEGHGLAPTPTNVGNVDHLARVASASRVAPREFGIQFLLCSGRRDSFISPRRLSRLRGNRATLPVLCRHPYKQLTLGRQPKGRKHRRDPTRALRRAATQWQAWRGRHCQQAMRRARSLRLRPAWRARVRLVGGATSVSLPCRYVETHDRLAHASPARRIAVVVRWSSSAAKKSTPIMSCQPLGTIPPGPALAREPMARNLRALMRAQYRQDHRCTAQHAVALDAPTVVPASPVEYLSCLRHKAGRYAPAARSGLVRYCGRPASPAPPDGSRRAPGWRRAPAAACAGLMGILCGVPTRAAPRRKQPARPLGPFPQFTHRSCPRRPDFARQ